MTTLHIAVGDQETLREEMLQFIQRANSDDVDPEDDRAVLQFETYDGLVNNLTPVRLELIKSIAAKRPLSMREGARFVDRDVSDVHGDRNQLDVLGILELEDGGPGGAIQPVVSFDAIEMPIDYPLLDDTDVDRASASAD